MQLVMEKTLDLLNDYTIEWNPYPQIVEQMSIIHEPTDGELVMYYIDPLYRTEGDKWNMVPSVRTYDPTTGETTGYKFYNYDEVPWFGPKARITRQKIDRLVLKHFPQIGAMASYKLSYRAISQLLLPVNNSTARQQAPGYTYKIAEDKKSITVYCTNPKNEQGEDAISYSCYRVTLQIDAHAVEYITYTGTITIAAVPMTGQYNLYVMGYINEGEQCSMTSEATLVDLVGRYENWPRVSPEFSVSYELSRDKSSAVLTASTGLKSEANMAMKDVVVTIPAADWVDKKATATDSSILATSSITLLPVLVANDTDITNNELVSSCGIYESSHTDGAVTLYAKTVPTEPVSIRLRIY